jgi:hypothetical protein
MLHQAIDMEKLERKHYLKHYLGGPAMVMAKGVHISGELEEIDLEDGSVSIKSGEESHWVDGDMVKPMIKSLDDLSDEDIKTICENVVINEDKIGSEIKAINKDYFRSFKGNGTKPFIYRITFINGKYLYITNALHIYSVRIDVSDKGRETVKIPIDNIATIIFLLCELGYDVTGIFKK